MSTRQTGTVVVGVDGSAEQGLTLRWALEEARIRDAPVRVVRVFAWPPDIGFSAEAYVMHSPGPSQELKEELEAAQAYLVEELGSDRVSGVLVTGRPADVLLDEAKHAQLVVVGSRSRTTAGAALLGSVTSIVAAHAPCPVIVARPARPHVEPARIVVGVDGSEQSERAVDFAFAEAAWRHLPLLAVQCWRGGDHLDPVVWEGAELAKHRERHREQVRELLARRRTECPGVQVTDTLIDGRPQSVLVHESQHAQLVVVGSRGHGGIAGLLLGSVSQSLLHHAHCSVAVVH